MSGIICAIRGGPASHSTIQKAIELARQEQRPLHLLYIINLDFLKHTSQSPTATLLDDMREMGEMLLLLAQEKAAAAGVAAQPTVREGSVGEQIARLCHEIDADYVVVGQPLAEGETAVFTEQSLHHLGRRLRKTCRAELVLVP